MLDFIYQYGDIILLNTANIIYIFCYGVRDVLWLRILAVSAMLLLMPYYAIFQMYSCLIWQVVFIAINVVWIVIILRARRPPKMTNEEQKLYESVFDGCCSPKDMLQLISRAKWIRADNGECLIKRETDLDQLLLIYSGNVSVQVQGKEVTTLKSGNLVGEMSFLTQNKTAADVLAQGPVRYLSWHRNELEKLFDNKVELKSAINELIGRDLVQKLTSQNTKAELTKTQT